MSTTLPHRIETTDVTSDVLLPREEGRLWTLVLSAIWGIPPLALTVPSTEQRKGFDSFDALKLGVLLMLTLLAVYCIATRWYRGAAWSRFWPIAGLVAYSSFGLVSVLWSPLRSVTIDKAGTLGLLCLVSIGIGCVANNRTNIERIIWHLSGSLMLFSAIVFAVYLYDPTLTGLDRLRIHAGGDGLIHPTASGATASLGLLILIIAKYWFRFDWVNRAIGIAMMTHLPVLFLSNSRMSTVALLITSSPILFRHLKSIHKAWILAVAAVSVLVMISVDPGLIGVGSSLESVGQYVTRGQTVIQLQQASGRTEMWEAVWGEFLKSPIVGHGYFVTSATGELEVWFTKTNHLAHNVFLQVLATTGLVGLIIFLVSMSLLALAMRQLARIEGTPRLISQTSFVFAVWFFLWCLLAEGFLGPLRPESLVFFVGCGLILAQIPAISELKHSPSKSVL